ncbi:hypothetical protein TTRE_0000620301 [Trichuris trichiura]|uniref:Uncharacterized protein n=1 Tax=Trichuris trichiura TaxID=36087 RepID=A0A077ZED1_TRITR|nr:hypothetical protein TTRE_0000620301 [Trichuris trichiura]
MLAIEAKQRPTASVVGRWRRAAEGRYMRGIDENASPPQSLFVGDPLDVLLVIRPSWERPACIDLRYNSTRIKQPKKDSCLMMEWFSCLSPWDHRRIAFIPNVDGSEPSKQ